jgi:hypothetical protein
LDSEIFRFLEVGQAVGEGEGGEGGEVEDELPGLCAVFGLDVVRREDKGGKGRRDGGMEGGTGG